MINRNASRIAAVLVTLGLIASMSAWAGSRGHHGHRRYHSYGHSGLYSYGGYSGSISVDHRLIPPWAFSPLVSAARSRFLTLRSRMVFLQGASDDG